MKLYADGSYGPKTKRGYWAVADSEGKEVASGIEENSSSNRGELLAAIAALSTQDVEVVDVHRNYFFTIYSAEYKKLTHNLDLTKKLVDFRGKAKVEWVPREHNTLADAIVRKLRKGDK